MKSIQIVLALIVFIFYPTISKAQQIESRYWYVEKIEVKQKKTTDFEHHLSELANACVVENFPHTFSVCKNNENIYYIFHEIPGISQIDKLQAIKMQTIENMRNERAYKKCILSTNTFVIKDLPELNYIPIEPRIFWEDVGFTVWEMHTLRQDQIEEYKENLQDFQSFKDHLHYNDPSFVFEIVEGVEDPTIVLMSYGRDHQDRLHENSRLWQVVGDEGRILFENLYPHMTDQNFLQLWKLNEASYRVQVVEEAL